MTFEFHIGSCLAGIGLCTASARLPGQMCFQCSRIEWPDYLECTDYSFVIVLA